MLSGPAPRLCPMTREQAGRGTPAHDRESGTILGVAPSKPVAPRATVEAPAPVPVDVDLDHFDVASPTPGPDAHEVLPEPRSPLDATPIAESATAERRTPSSYERLGAAAAANAALHASGAPTPLGGVPRVEAGATGAHHDLAHDAPAFVPTFAPVTGPAGARGASAPDAPDADDPRAAEPPAWLALAQHPAAASSGSTQDPPLYRPRVIATAFPAVDAGAAGPDAPVTEPGSDDDGTAPAAAAPPVDRRPRDRAWPLILVGLLVLGGILAGAAWYLLRADTIDIPGQKVLVPPVERALDPIVVEDPTPFLAAMPTTSGLWSLTAVRSPNPENDQALPDRVTEVQVLTYGDGTSEITLKARQLYSEADAQKALTRAAGKGVELTDATVAGEAVGRRAVVESEDGTTVMWTNGSAFFEATGPAGEVEPFVDTLGL